MQNKNDSICHICMIDEYDRLGRMKMLIRFATTLMTHYYFDIQSISCTFSQ